MQAWNQLLDTLRTTGASVRFGARSIRGQRKAAPGRSETDTGVTPSMVPSPHDCLITTPMRSTQLGIREAADPYFCRVWRSTRAMIPSMNRLSIFCFENQRR
jgi:hypothetical protein